MSRHVGKCYGLSEALDLDRPIHCQIAMQTLAVHIIFANRPQARGRGERVNQSIQDRLVAELDHHHITGPALATALLNRVFIPKCDRRFGVQPREANSAFRPVSAGLDLRTVLCAETTRVVASGNTIRYHGQVYQLKPNTRTVCVAGSQVSVQAWSDGLVHVRHERAGTTAITPALYRHRPQHPPKRLPP